MLIIIVVIIIMNMTNTTTTNNNSKIMLIIIIIIIIIIIDEQRSQKPTSLLAFPKFSAVAFLRGDLLCTDIIIIMKTIYKVPKNRMNGTLGDWRLVRFTELSMKNSL